MGAMPAAAAPDKLAPADLARWLYPLAFLVGATLVLGFMWYHIASERRVVMDHWHARLTTFAGDRARLVSDWLVSRKDDA